jgi:carbon monoxide dehydrogenase subunit G
MRIEVSRRAAAPPTDVWDVLVDWERQPQWMVDAKSVEVVSERRAGVGVRLRCPTRVVLVTVTDVMEVTDWEPPHRLRVRHHGRLIRGSGEFRIAADGDGSRITWVEEIETPGAWLARPYVRWLFGRSLENLADLCG